MKQILILKLNPLEDIIYTLPFLNNLKSTYTKSTISWLTSSHCQEILEEHSALNELIIYKRKKQFSARLFEMLDFFKTIRQEEFDLLIDLQGGLKGYFFALFIKAKQKISFSKYPYFALLSPYSRLIFSKKKTNQLTHLAQLNTPLAISNNPPLFKIEIASQDKETIEYLFMQNGIKKQAPVILLCPITKLDGSLGWEITQFNKLIETVIEHKIIPIVIGNKEDAHLLRNINKALLLTDISLKQKCYLIQKSTYIVSNDNEWVDIALSLGKEVIFVALENTALERTIFKDKIKHQSANNDYLGPILKSTQSLNPFT